jgi:tetratricopeptide (TPR) repeat protein
VEGHAKLAAALPGIPDYQHDLALSYDSLASLQHGMGDLAGAAKSYSEGIVLATRIVAAQPELKDYQETLGMLHANLGNVKQTAGDNQGAAESLREAINIETKLVDAHRDVPDYASMLGNAYERLGLVLVALGRNDEAERIYRQAIERQRKTVANWPDEVGLRTRLAAQIMGLAGVLRLQGRITAASEAARELLTLQPREPVQLYNAACELALCAQAELDETRKQTLADSAVTSLRGAIAAGWRDAIRTSLDRDLDPLRARADFQRLLEELFDGIFPADPFEKGETTLKVGNTSREGSEKP